jgi:hypothetical protein
LAQVRIVIMGREENHPEVYQMTTLKLLWKDKTEDGEATFHSFNNFN